MYPYSIDRRSGRIVAIPRGAVEAKPPAWLARGVKGEGRGNR